AVPSSSPASLRSPCSARAWSRGSSGRRRGTLRRRRPPTTMGDDTPTANLRALPPAPGSPPPRTPWSDVVLQLGQSLLTVGGALVLVKWGVISGELAAGAIGLGGAPAF